MVLASVDKDLEKAVKKVMDTKEKFESRAEVEKCLGDWLEEPKMDEIYAAYSGELFARLMEITKDDAQKMVRNEGIKSGRCAFYVMKKLGERHNPKSYQRHLRLLLNVTKPNEAKTIKEVQATVEDWENKLR